MRIFALILMVVSPVFQASADDTCGKLKEVAIPPVEFRIKAGGEQVLVPAVAYLEVMDDYDFTIMSPDDGFWINHHDQVLIPLEFDEANRVIRTKPTTIKLGLMFNSPRVFPFWPCRKFVSEVRLDFNTYGYVKPEFRQGTQYTRLKDYGVASKHAWHGVEDGLDKFFSESVYEYELEESPSVTGTLSYAGDGSMWKWEMAREEGDAVKVQYWGKEGEQCLNNLARLRRPVTLYGTWQSTGTQWERFEARDIGMTDQEITACAQWK